MADTGWEIPGAWGDDYNDWTDPANLRLSDNMYCTTDILSTIQDMYNYGITFGGADTLTIDGIDVSVEAKATLPVPFQTAQLRLSLSWDGGTNYTASVYRSWGNIESVQSFGSSTSLWGRAWTKSDFTNTNFRIRMEYVPTKGSIAHFNPGVDRVWLKVWYTILSREVLGGAGIVTRDTRLIIAG